MVDVDNRINSQHQAHVAGLKRLSARAHAGPTTPSSAGRRVYFSFATYARNVIEHLKGCRVTIENGLSDEEFARIEGAFGLTFPPDLKAILQEGLPVGVGFPDWRRVSSQRLQARLDLPIAGLLYEVAKCTIWWKPWGPRPDDIQQSVQVALAALRKAPALLPVYNHCYIPCAPNLAGNPVFFVHRKDCFISGSDIQDFVTRQEFKQLEFDHPDSFTEFMHWADDNGRNGIGRLISGRDYVRERARVFGREDTISGRSKEQDIPEERKSLESPWKAGSEGEEGVENRHSSGKEIESWGRNLDSVAMHPEVFLKNSDLSWKRPSSFRLGATPRARSPLRTSDQDVVDVISKLRYFEEKSQSNKALKHFTGAAPHWAAKAAGRRIDFWSDFVDKRLLVEGTGSENLFSASKVDVDLANLTNRWDDEAIEEFQNAFLPRWLTNYLEDIAVRLRKGGWKENDIMEMLEFSSAPGLHSDLDQQAMLDELSKQAELLATCLKMGGWSVRDVADVLTMDFRLREHRRSPSKITPELAARLSTFADYVVSAK